MSYGETLRTLRRLEPVTCSELAAAIGGKHHTTAEQALFWGMERGLVWRRKIKRGYQLVYQYRTTALGRADCECGRPKEIDLEACSYCLYLDGEDRPGMIIAALRGTDGLTLRELCVELGMNSDIGNGQRDIWRYVQRLMEQRRIRRYWREEVCPTLTKATGFAGNAAYRQARAGWAYALDGQTAKQWRAA